MNNRHPQNTNLILHTEPLFQGLPVYTDRGPLIRNYLERIHETILRSLHDHPRVAGFRFDLRFPLDMDQPVPGVLSRFFDSLRAQFLAYQQKTVRNRDRVVRVPLRYVWVKEEGQRGMSHYHVLILVNQDVFKWMGDYSATNGNMAARIKKAWATALGIAVEDAAGLVHFPENATYRLNTVNYPDCFGLPDLFYRVSYFAKVQTKQYGDESNHFGCSRN